MEFYLDIWATRTGDRSLSGYVSFSPYCFPVACSPVGCAAWSVMWALGALASTVNIKIKSYIESVLKVIKECLQKRGSPKGRQATNTCLPTWSDPPAQARPRNA